VYLFCPLAQKCFSFEALSVYLHSFSIVFLNAAEIHHLQSIAMRPSQHILTAILPFTLLSDTYAQQSITNPTTRAEFALSALQIWYNAGTGLWNTCGWWNSANVMTMITNLAKYDSSPQLQDLSKRIFANTIVNAPAKNPQPGVEGQALSQRKVSTVANTGYDKISGDEGEVITTYPKGWSKIRWDQDYKVEDIQLKLQGDPVNVAAVPNPSDWLDGFYDDDLWWALAWIGAYDITKNVQYLQLAEGIFMATTKVWPTRCFDGGIWWS
jgi:hypothetical protein